MSTLADLARDLAEADSAIPWNSGPARGIIAKVAAELRALAGRPTPEDAALVERAARLTQDRWDRHGDPIYTVASDLRALAARLAAQQPAPPEGPGASPWEQPCGKCGGTMVTEGRSVIGVAGCVPCEPCHGRGFIAAPALRELIRVLRVYAPDLAR